MQAFMSLLLYVYYIQKLCNLPFKIVPFSIRSQSRTTYMLYALIPMERNARLRQVEKGNVTKETRRARNDKR